MSQIWIGLEGSTNLNYWKHMIYKRIRKTNKAARKLVVGRKCGMALGLVVAFPHVVGISVMVVLGEEKIDAC